MELRIANIPRAWNEEMPHLDEADIDAFTDPHL